MDTNAKLDAAMEYIRRKLTNRIHEIRSTEKLMELPLQSKGIDTPVPEIVALDIPDVDPNAGHKNLINQMDSGKRDSSPAGFEADSDPDKHNTPSSEVMHSSNNKTSSVAIRNNARIARANCALLLACHVIANAPLHRCGYVYAIIWAHERMRQHCGQCRPYAEILLLALCKGEELIKACLRAFTRLVLPDAERDDYDVILWETIYNSDEVQELDAWHTFPKTCNERAKFHRLQMNTLCSHNEHRDHVGLMAFHDFLEWMRHGGSEVLKKCLEKNCTNQMLNYIKNSGS